MSSLIRAVISPLLNMFSQANRSFAWQLLIVLIFVAGVEPKAAAQESGRIPPWPSQASGGRILGPYLWKGTMGPDAILAPLDEKPVFAWQSLLVWHCGGRSDTGDRAVCAQRFMDGGRLPVASIRVIGTQRAGIPESRQYRVELLSGQRNDVWLLQGATALPVELEDGSRIESQCIEDLVVLPRAPWGDALETPSYTHLLGRDCFRYFRRIRPDGRTAWSRAFLLQATGSLTDRSLNETEDNPVLDFFRIYAIPTTDLGVMRTWLSDPSLAFGSVSVGVNLISGELLSHDHRVMAAESAEVAALFSATVNRLINDGQINERNTEMSVEHGASQQASRRLGDAQNAFELAIRQALVENYFNKFKGRNK